MDTLNYDIINIILKQLSASERLRLNTVFNEHRPTQFQVSSELIASKDFRGNKGLFMRAATTGEYEPCVQAMILIQKQHLQPEQLAIYEGHIRSDFMDYDPDQRADSVFMRLTYGCRDIKD
jgi:hypothetical protein